MDERSRNGSIHPSTREATPERHARGHAALMRTTTSLLLERLRVQLWAVPSAAAAASALLAFVVIWIDGATGVLESQLGISADSARPSSRRSRVR